MKHWTVRVRITTEDPDTGKEKGRNEAYLVAADTIDAAQVITKEYFKGLMCDYEIRGISGSNIIEYVNTETIA
jgi:hypothetical protein